MRPLFAIAPLALAFVLLGPTTTEVSSTASPSLVAKVWHLVFDRESSPAQVKPPGTLSTTATLAQ
jgi:hypothetical protein